MVTTFSISELARASSTGKVLMRMVGLGISSAACLSSASAALAAMHCFKTVFESSSVAGGSFGSSLYGLPGDHPRRLYLSSDADS